MNMRVKTCHRFPAQPFSSLEPHRVTALYSILGALVSPRSMDPVNRSIEVLYGHTTRYSGWTQELRENSRKLGECTELSGGRIG